MVEVDSGKIIKSLLKSGYYLSRHGDRHDFFTKSGFPDAVVPRHKTLSTNVARKLWNLTRQK
jgi:predicted RNA binding protein YcfA (HicA-like mRNA interferase family)